MVHQAHAAATAPAHSLDQQGVAQTLGLGMTWEQFGQLARTNHKCQGTSQLEAFPGDTAGIYTLVDSRPQSRGTERDPFDGIDYQLSRTGLPILAGVTAWFECHNRSRYEEGDHVIFVGEVERCGFAEGSPLVFQGGQFSTTRDLP